MEKAETICVAANHHRVQTEITIEATQSGVWSVLTDFKAMPNWSPSFKGIIGSMSDGAQVTTLFDLGDGVEAYQATLKLEQGASFGWSEDYDGIRDNHLYIVERVSEMQTKFYQTDAFIGQADWSTTEKLSEFYVEQYAEFNRALKVECERRFPSPK
jgi:hypothetical protein